MGRQREICRVGSGSDKYSGTPGSSGFPSFLLRNPVLGFPNFRKKSSSRRESIEEIVKVKLRVCRSDMRERSQLKCGGILAHLHVQFFVGASSIGREEPVLRWFLQISLGVSRRESAHQVDQGHLAPTTQVQDSCEFHVDPQAESGPAFALNAASQAAQMESLL